MGQESQASSCVEEWIPSGCEGKLGVALESLQGRRDLTYACVRDVIFLSREGRGALAGPDREEAPRAPCFFTSFPSSDGT